MKTASKGRKPQNIINGISQQPLIGSYSNFKLHILKILKMKTTYNGRRPQNIKTEISQQPLIRSSSNFKQNL
jgi:hypothetical protein